MNSILPSAKLWKYTTISCLKAETIAEGVSEKVLQAVDEYNGYWGNLQKGLEVALTILGDNHSSFVCRNGGEVEGRTMLRCLDEEPPMLLLDSTIGYVKVGTFKSESEAETTVYIASIQQQIREADNPNIKGWIVDLRENGGGYYVPMLRGVASFLEKGDLMFFMTPDSTFSSENS
ncbi:S41 family peptidase [Segetibacter koreensis]|uniref:S41 family peptidase n=1 Tax=Segetibacter koreensis TaxID=398037 RepID=UPI00037AB2F5|nr:S41 family peptidase [Segetibacter koreensis]